MNFNNSSTENYQHYYKSISHFGHTVFKYQGRCSVARHDFWLAHFENGGHKVFTTTEYLGDRVNENFSLFTG